MSNIFQRLFGQNALEGYMDDYGWTVKRIGEEGGDGRAWAREKLMKDRIGFLGFWFLILAQLALVAWFWWTTVQSPAPGLDIHGVVQRLFAVAVTIPLCCTGCILLDEMTFGAYASDCGSIRMARRVMTILYMLFCSCLVGLVCGQGIAGVI